MRSKTSSALFLVFAPIKLSLLNIFDCAIKLGIQIFLYSASQDDQPKNQAVK